MCLDRRAPDAAPRSDGRRATDPRLTTRAIADKLGVGTQFVLDEIHDGRLDALVLERPGARRVYRVTPQAFDEYLARHRWRPPAAR